MNKTPSLASLLYRAKSAITNKVGASNPATDAIAAAIAGVSYGQYAYQDYLFKQLNPETADEEWLYLWANRFKVERLAFAFSTGTVNFQLTQGVVNIPKSVILKTSDNKEYQVTAETNSDQPVPVQAVESGVAGNLPADVNLYLVTAVTGLNPDDITSNETAGGAGLEEVEHWRDRIVLAFNVKNAVGREQDYVFWAKSAHADIDYAWSLDNTPVLGNVTVYIGQRDNNPVLVEQIRVAAQDYIDANRLAGCHVFVQLPTLNPVTITISNVADITIRNKVEAALQTFFNNRLDNRTQLMANEVSTVISGITNQFTLVLPNAPTTFLDNELLTYGGVLWQ
jgi:uncharacterized phage protein gp47/JayE